MSVIMKKNEYGSTAGKYGRNDCEYCDGKNIKREHMGAHLFKFHKDKLKENFAAYLKMPNWNQPFIDTSRKLYTFCFVCHKCHSTSCSMASKPAIKHMEGKCSFENQYFKLKEFCEDTKPVEQSPDIIIIPVSDTPTYKTHISNNECSIHAAEIATLKKEIAKIKDEMINFFKDNYPKISINEIPPVCTDCVDWRVAYNKLEDTLSL